MLCKDFSYPTLMHYFEEISAIPRGSGHEEGIVAYLLRFAEERGLASYTDEYKNVLIRMPASKGYEEKAPVLLQGHTDMVCEKNRGVNHDFLTDPLKLYLEDGWLRAEGTTLGADDGVAVAVMLALLDGASEAHPALECLFTSCEETGMDGAIGFDYGRLYARRMINMDGCDDRTVLTGCAGGLRSQIELPVASESYAGKVLTLSIGGLAGGHSGEDIHRGRANAIKLMGGVLVALCERDPSLRLLSLCGGDKDNAIPREAVAVISVSDCAKAREGIVKAEKELRGTLSEEDRGFFLSVTESDREQAVLTRESTERVIRLVQSAVSGVISMHPHFEEMVSTSCNLGAIRADGTGASAVSLFRSDREECLDEACRTAERLAEALGGSCHHPYRFPGWEYSKQSEIREAYQMAYRVLYGKEIGLESIHAGLECGVMKRAVPDMDMICVGPRVVNLHSPDEALDVDSFARFFETVLLTLKLL